MDPTSQGGLKAWLGADLSQARAFGIYFLLNLTPQTRQRAKTGGNRRRRVTVLPAISLLFYLNSPSQVLLINIDYSANDIITKKRNRMRPATSPTLVLKSWLGLREVEDRETKFDARRNRKLRS